jgi:hypothetical protein
MKVNYFNFIRAIIPNKMLKLPSIFIIIFSSFHYYPLNSEKVVYAPGPGLFLLANLKC